MENFSHFVLPFVIGAYLLLIICVYKFIRWFKQFDRLQRATLRKNMFTGKLFPAVWEMFKECLLHVRITKKNWRLGYMHRSIAFGWFMLIVLGGRFEFSAVREKWKPITLGVIMRLIAAPVLTLVPAYFLLPQLGGQHVAAYLALFGTPVAVSSAVMAREMHSDDVLAGQLVVWTTVLSMFTLFGEIILARTLGWL